MLKNRFHSASEALLLLVFAACWSFSGVATADDCAEFARNDLSIAEHAGVRRDIAQIFDVDYAGFACVSRTEESSEEYCGRTTKPFRRFEPPPNTSWNGLTLENELLQLVLPHANYSYCTDIFEDDAVLEASLKSVPSLTPQSYRHHLRLSNSSLRSYSLSDNPHPPTTHFSFVQEKLLKVFEATGEWAYCDGSKIGPLIDGRIGKSLAYFDQKTFKVTFFEGMCTTKKLYQLDISAVATTHRAFFVAAHELGHAIEAVAGIRRPYSLSEAYATYYGTLFAQCMARQLISHHEEHYKHLEESQLLTHKEKKYARCAVARARDMERFFYVTRSQIDLRLGTVPETVKFMSEFDILH